MLFPSNASTQCLTYLLTKVIYNLYFHPLYKYPGPSFRCAFNFASIFEIWWGNSVQHTHALHEKYGATVRIAPDALSFTTAQAWKDIYGFQQNRRQIPKDYKRVPDIADPLPILCMSHISTRALLLLTKQFRMMSTIQGSESSCPMPFRKLHSVNSCPL